MSRERPIIFRAPMVRAILEGRKTQTRRVVKGLPDAWNHYPAQVAAGLDCATYGPTTVNCHFGLFGSRDAADVHARASKLKCPYGVVGDRLWVKETWAYGEDLAADDNGIYYRATDPGWDENCVGHKWRSPLFMPRSASRITLKVTGVRVERLKRISDADVKAEGVDPVITSGTAGYDDQGESYIEGYKKLWESIHGEGSWDANPWVWVIEFEREVTE